MFYRQNAFRATAFPERHPFYSRPLSPSSSARHSPTRWVMRCRFWKVEDTQFKPSLAEGFLGPIWKVCIVQCDCNIQKRIYFHCQQWWFKFWFHLLHNKDCRQVLRLTLGSGLQWVGNPDSKSYSPEKWQGHNLPTEKEKVTPNICRYHGDLVMKVKHWPWKWKWNLVFADITKVKVKHLSLQTSWKWK